MRDIPLDATRLARLLEDYLAGSTLIRRAVAGLSPEQFRAKPIPGKWSIHEVVCHLADCEILYADRMTRVLAEDTPTLMNVDPDIHVPKLALPTRDMDEELQLIEAIRKHTGRILQAAALADFQRQGNHSADGPLSLETLLVRITGHIPHHVRFIEEKRKAMGA